VRVVYSCDRSVCSGSVKKYSPQVNTLCVRAYASCLSHWLAVAGPLPFTAAHKKSATTSPRSSGATAIHVTHQRRSRRPNGSNALRGSRCNVPPGTGYRPPPTSLWCTVHARTRVPRTYFHDHVRVEQKYSTSSTVHFPFTGSTDNKSVRQSVASDGSLPVSSRTHTR